tara:strand:- start:272 stop:865 length:594 start_codon:yes stop_codon:yes gene_type:complete
MERTKSLGTLDNMDIPNRMQKPENMPVNTSSMEFSPAEYIKLAGFSLDDLFANPTMSISATTSVEMQDRNPIVPNKTPSLQQKMRMADRNMDLGSMPKNDMTRVDGTRKSSRGFLGPIKNKRGQTMTEVSVEGDIDGEEVLFPLLVPTLTDAEIKIIQDNDGFEGRAKDIPERILKKAKAHAKKRIKQGLNPFSTMR